MNVNQFAKRASIAASFSFLFLTACGGGSDSSSTTISTGISPSTTAASTSSCVYADRLQAITRTNAQKDVQCQVLVTASDSLRNTAAANCRAGDVKSADIIYNDQYLKVSVPYTDANVQAICGGTPGIALPSGTVGGGTYSLWVLYDSRREVVSGTCSTSLTAPYPDAVGATWYLAGSGLTLQVCRDKGKPYGLIFS